MRFLWLLPIALVVGLDQLTKYLIVQNMAHRQSITIIDGILDFTFIYNDGASMGILSNSRWIFMSASTIVILAVIAFMLFFYKKYYHPLLFTALSFVVGGGIGNMLDRLGIGYALGYMNHGNVKHHVGEVIDFINVRFIPFWKWIFNVADIFVCVGAALVVIHFIVSDIAEKKKKKAND